MKNKLALIFALGIIVPLVISINFTSNPVINNNEPTDTTAPLNCVWASSGDTTQTNVTWFLNGVINTTETNVVGGSSTISNILTSKGQVWVCQVNITNGTTTVSSSDSITIANAGPTELEIYQNGVLISGNTTVVYEDTLYSFDINSTDPDGDTIQYSNTPSTYFTANINDGTFTWTPIYTDSSLNVTLRAEDTSKGSNTIMEFIIVQINDSPVLQAIGDQTATEGTPFYPTITVTDEENDPSNFSISYSKVNGEGTLSSLIINKMTGFTANLTFNRSGNTPEFSERGNYSVTVTVFDETNASRNDSETFNLEIISVNQAPSLYTIPNATANQGDTFFLEVNSTDNDTDDSSTFSIQAINCNIADPWSITDTNTSNNGTGTINLVLTNNHVICPDVTITVQDGSGSTDSQNVYFNILNTNDPPVIRDYSNSLLNTVGNNLTNLTGGNGAIFTYQLNYSDNDSLTYEGESLAISTNESLFQFDNNGLMNFSINDSYIGNWSVEINVSDDGGLSVIQIMTIELMNNTIPSINNLSQSFCYEDVACTIYVTAQDGDPGENITFTSNSSIFNITYYNSTAARMQATYNNDDVGNYSIRIIATDSIGASSNRTFSFEVINTNDPPYFDMNQDEVADNITLGLIVETYQVYYIVNISDEDLIYGDDISFNYTLLAGNPSVFSLTKNSSNQAIINFTPQIGTAGNYSINITITDTAYNNVSQILNFTIFPKSGPPTINHVRPYFDGSSTQFSLAANTFGAFVNINFTENNTVLFDVNATDPDGDTLNYTWYVNGVVNATSRPQTYSFNFASEGSYLINVTVEDEFFESTSFVWNLTVSNLNRKPQLLNNLENLTGNLQVNGTTTFSNYFSKFNSVQRFYDADDDTNGNLGIDGSETFSLTITAQTTCLDQVSATVASFSVSGSSLTVTPAKLGQCVVWFNATDSYGATTKSNNITVNVSKLDAVVSSSSSTSSSSSSSSGGGGGTRTQTIVVPLTQEVDSPAPLKIITPGEVVIYQQKVIAIPITLQSNWTETLFGITIEAESNNTEIEMNLSQSSFNSIAPGESQDLTLTVTNFREGGPYEIAIIGSVDSPEYVDQEIILVNSIEAANEGDAYETKISFARDFFNENKECQELNEILQQAEDSATTGNYREAINYVDVAINGCKYLASQVVDVETQNPSYVRTIREFTQDNMVAIIIGSAGLMIVALGIFFTRKSAFEQ